jgi:RHS repeat-associated protein
VQGNVDILNWILADHLGSTSITAAADGSKIAELRYSAFGEVRFSSGITPTEYQYTGQLNVSTIKLSWFNSRWYDSALGQFIQPDTLISDPNKPGAWNRYLYALGNPIRYIDPTGHDVDCSAGDYSCRLRVNIEKVTTYPDAMCKKNSACVASYYTYIELSVQKGHALSDAEVIKYVADTEYTSYATREEVHGWMKEGMARQYWETYEACEGPGHGRCSNNKIQMFAAGFAAFFDDDVAPTAYQRAIFILEKSSRAIPVNSVIVDQDIKEILDPAVAKLNDWDQGAVGNEPWQWVNLQYPDTEGKATDSPYVDGTYLWLVTFSQNVALGAK